MVVMRWMTRECLTGGLDDQDWQRRHDEHAAHSAEFSASLAPDSPERQLADLNLRDGIPKFWNLDGNTAELIVIIGDFQRGYEWARIRYANVELASSPGVLDDDGAELLNCEIGADEMEQLPDGRFEQRFLLWPDGSVGITFSTCRVTLRTATPAERDSAGTTPNGSSKRS